jgi:hypothetical protein
MGIFKLTYLVGSFRARQSFLQLVWFVCVWVLWNKTNLRVFKNSANTMHQLLDKVKSFSYRWLTVVEPFVKALYIINLKLQ